MKKTLVLIRHAKAAVNDHHIADFDRPLTEKGKTDAQHIGEVLKELNLIPDLIIASPAKRTRQTAKKIAESMGYAENKIEWEDKLYQCTASAVENNIIRVKDTVNTLFLVAHNPAITEFASQIDPAFKIENIPPCGVVAAQIDAEKWIEFGLSKRKVFLFKYPLKDNDLR